MDDQIDQDAIAKQWDGFLDLVRQEHARRRHLSYEPTHRFFKKDSGIKGFRVDIYDHRDMDDNGFAFRRRHCRIVRSFTGQTVWHTDGARVVATADRMLDHALKELAEVERLRNA